MDLYLHEPTLLHVLLRDNITVPYTAELTSSHILPYSAEVVQESVDEQCNISFKLVMRTFTLTSTCSPK